METTVHSERKTLVWDRFVRLFHWSLVVSYVVAYFSADSHGLTHEVAGYAALGLVLARIVWGFVGSPHARFADFVPTPSGLARYLRALLRGREPHTLGHNPAGAVMILFLLVMTVGIGASGWLLTTDWFWGSELMETLHAALVDVTLVAVALHIGANVYESLRQRENLILSMFTGFKRAPPSDSAAHRSN
jgi:cytochrome b